MISSYRGKESRTQKNIIVWLQQKWPMTILILLRWFLTGDWLCNYVPNQLKIYSRSNKIKKKYKINDLTKFNTVK